jgi:hypothetical protein
MTCKKFTIFTRTEAGVIVEAAPIAKRFIGQPLHNLSRWMVKFGGYSAVRLGGESYEEKGRINPHLKGGDLISRSDSPNGRSVRLLIRRK